MKKIYFDEISSTQLYAKEKAKTGVKNEIYIAREQSDGIGRNGHTWTSNFGGLYFSFITDSYNDIYTITLGVAINLALKELYNIDTKIKWPNDILLAGKKVAGVICEKVENFVVAGIGINTNFDESKLGEFKNIATTIESFSKVEVNNDILLDKIIEKVDMLKYNKETIAIFRKNMAFLGHVRFVSQINKQALIKDIDNQGNLIVEESGNEYKIIGGTI